MPTLLASAPSDTEFGGAPLRPTALIGMSVRKGCEKVQVKEPDACY